MTYSKKPSVNRSVRSRPGNTGSQMFCQLASSLCQAKNRTHNITEMDKRLKTTAEVHEYSVPPSSTADTNNVDAANIRKVPRKSTLLSACIVKDLERSSDLDW